MSVARRLVLALLATAALTALAAAQPNPYRTVEGWARLPEGRTWGATSAVDIDKNGRFIWVAERCGANSCLGSDLPVVLEFDPSGALVKSFGGGLMVFPHGIHVDREGNVWVTDGQDNKPRRPRGAPPDAPLPPAPAKLMGHQVFKFSPDGTLLMTLGAAGGGTGAGGFFQPNDVVTDTNGDIYVAEGHGGDNARIVVFDGSGKYLREFGKKGSGPGEFDQPHGLAFDAKGRLFVADRSNNRVQIVDRDGKFLEEWRQFSRPSGIYIRGEFIYVADSESGSVGSARSRTEWKRGIRVGMLEDAKVIALIPDSAEQATNTSGPEGVAADADGNVFGAEVGQKSLKKYVHRGAAQAPAGDMTGTSTGVYTAAQAAKGEETYMSMCVACHPAGTYSTPAFREKWNGEPLADLFTLVSETMPKQEPASLTPAEYAQTVAYLLKINDAPAGKTELPPDLEALKKIRIEMATEKK